jgi:hypothetical protein
MSELGIWMRTMAMSLKNRNDTQKGLWTLIIPAQRWVWLVVVRNLARRVSWKNRERPNSFLSGYLTFAQVRKPWLGYTSEPGLEYSGTTVMSLGNRLDTRRGFGPVSNTRPTLVSGGGVWVRACADEHTHKRATRGEQRIRKRHSAMADGDASANDTRATQLLRRLLKIQEDRAGLYSLLQRYISLSHSFCCVRAPI